jgi:hypothetical protein
LGKSLTYVDIAIRAAEEKKGVRREDINAILLVGGSTKIPRVRSKLLEYFQRDEDFVRSDLDGDAVVARGAAMMALQLSPTSGEFDISREADPNLVNVDLEDGLQVSLITEHSLGVGVQNNLVDKIVDQGTGIPVSVTKGGYTNAGPTPDIEVRVYQGEGQYVYENTLIGVIHLGPMEPKPEGHHRFEVTFSLDINGILSVTVHHQNEGQSYHNRFEQPTGIGGHQALAKRRNALLRMFGEQRLDAAEVPATGQAAPPAPPPTSRLPYPAATPPGTPYPAQGAPVVPPMPAESTPPTPPMPPQPAPRGSQVPPTPSPQEAAIAATSPPAEDRTGDVEIIEPVAEVPDQFKSIVRRARKLMLKNPDPRLISAFNSFTAALNGGNGEEELADLGDELEDTYHDCRG